MYGTRVLVNVTSDAKQSSENGVAILCLVESVRINHPIAHEPILGYASKSGTVRHIRLLR